MTFQWWRKGSADRNFKISEFETFLIIEGEP
jgi:hypothetical protein